MNGDRITENFSIRVGSGTGPITRAPVRSDLDRRLVQDAMIVCLEADPDTLLGHSLLPDPSGLGEDLGHRARADGPTTLADRKAHALVQGDRLDQFHFHLDVIAGQHHLHVWG